MRTFGIAAPAPTALDSLHYLSLLATESKSTSSLVLLEPCLELANEGPTRRCSTKASLPCVDSPGDAATGDWLADAISDAIRLGRGLL